MVDNPSIVIDQVQDQYVRENFKALKDYFQAQNQLLDFKFFELVFDAAKTDFSVAHGLKFIPLDVIVTHLTGSGDVTFKYSAFTKENIVLDVTGACRIRFFIGTYSKFSSKEQIKSTDAQLFGSGV